VHADDEWGHRTTLTRAARLIARSRMGHSV
jgi:hypothetical protein